MSRVRVRVEGLNQVGAKLNGNKLYAGPIRKVMERSVEVIAGKAEERAPRKSFKMAGSIETQVDRRPLPTWARVVVTASGRGKHNRYPWILESGHKARRGARGGVLGFGRIKGKMGTYTRTPKGRRKFVFDTSKYVNLHYAGTRKSTKGWFKGASRGMRPKIKQLLDQAAREVQQNWQR